MQIKNTFNAEKKIKEIRAKSERAMNLMMSDVLVDIQRRIDSGIGVNGERYTYSKYTAEKKGKIAPVDWNDTGLLKRSMDFLVKIAQNSIDGFIGIKNVNRGITSNREIHEKLNKQYPGFWGISQTEKKRAFDNFLRYFRK